MADAPSDPPNASGAKGGGADPSNGPPKNASKDGASGDAASKPRLALLRDACALGAACALVGSLPSALRVTRAGGPLLGGWLGTAATVLPLIVGLIALGAAAGRGFRLLTGNRASRATAAGLALWLGLVAPVLAVLGSILKTGTNHRGIGGATFGVMALAIVVLGAIVAYRLLSLSRSVVERGVRARVVAIVFAAVTILPPFATAFMLGRSNDESQTSRAVIATLIDSAIFVVAAALAAAIDLKPETRVRTRVIGPIVAIALFGGGFAWVALSPTLGGAIRGGGGLAATLVSTLQGWTDKDGDGRGAYFGGGDCDDHDPARTTNCAGPAAAASIGAPAGSVEATDDDGEEKVTRGKSIFVISVESLRADHTNPYGYDAKTTPNLSALAKEGWLFSHAYSAGIDTQHAITPLVSGVSLSAMAHDRKEWFDVPSEVDTLAERMSKAGYATFAVTSFTWLTEDHGFNQGFDQFHSVFHEDHPERGITGPHAVRTFRAFLKKADADAKPIFAWLHLFDTHKKFLPHTGLEFGHSEQGLYDGEVAFVDQRIGEVVTAIRESAHGEGAIILVHGAWGQSFNEHKKPGFYDESASVPMIIAGAGTGVFDKAAVSTLDVVPTVLDLAGIQADPQLPGRSLVGHASGKVQPAPIVLDSGKERAVVDWPLVLLAGGGGTHLFDVSKDPSEKNDLEKTSDADRLRKLLDSAAEPRAGKPQRGDDKHRAQKR